MGGDQVGPWQLDRLLGRGGMGEVWLARHVTLGVPVALKILAAEAAANPGLCAAWEVELEAQARMCHPGVVSLRERGRLTVREAEARAGWETSLPWMAMEWVDGGTLGQLGTGLPWRQLRALVLRMLDLLAHCHASGVVHRDLKPANVLIDERGWPRLTDFGLAHLCDRIPPDAVRGVPAGTPGYMAPEQFRGRWRDFGPWTDLYGLACLVWRLIAGRTPFVGPDFRAVARLHLRQDPPPLTAGAPPGLEEWLRWLLSKSPTARPASAAEAALALTRLPAGGLPVASGSGRGLRRLLVGTAQDPGGWRGSGGRARRSEPAAGLGASLVGLAPPPLVERPALMDRLWSHLTEMVQSRAPAALVLRGAEGVGKTRLAHWLCMRAGELGLAERWWSPLLESPDGRELWRQGLRSWELDPAVIVDMLARSLGPDAERAALISLCRWVSGEPWEGLDEQEAARLQARTLAALSQRRPIILVLDGLEHAPEQRHMVEAVLAQPNARVLVLITATDAVNTAAMPEVEVGPLLPGQLRRLVRSLAGLKPSLIAEVEASAAGNPMVATQLVATWARQRRLEPAAGGLRLDGAGPNIPGSLGMTWRRRVELALRGFSSDAAMQCERLALAGLHVDEDLLAELVPEGASALLEALADEGLLIRRSDGRRGWAHGLVRDALSQRARRRGRLRDHHRWLARRWDRAGGQPAEEIGRHWLLAGEPARALPLLLAGVEALAGAGRLHRARAALEDWRQAACQAEEGVTALQQGRCWGVRLARRIGDVREVRGELRRLEAGPAGPGVALEVRKTRAWLLSRQGAPRQAVAELEQLLDEGCAQATPAQVGKLAWALAEELRGLGRLDEALVRIDQARRHAAAAGDIRDFQRCTLARAELLLLKDDIGEATAAIEGLRLDLQAHPGSLLRARLFLVEGDLAHRRGQLAGAEAAWQEALAGLRAHGLPEAIVVQWRLASLELERGRPDRALDGAGAVQAEARLAERPADVARGALLEAAAQAGRGRWAEADAALMKARVGLSDTGIAESHSAWMVSRLRVAARGAPDPALETAACTLLLELGIALGSERWVQEARRALDAVGAPVAEVLADGASLR